MTDKIIAVIAAFILSLGILGAGFSIGKGVYLVRKMNRVITVKGLAEQNVKSDLGIWEINYREIGNDLVQLDQRLQHDQLIVKNFLKQQGFDDSEIDLTQIKVEDRMANVYNENAAANANQSRFVVTTGVRVRSQKVDLIQKSLQVSNLLLQQGVPVAFDVSTISPNPSYLFTKLDSIRPKMLADATKSARTVAEQFAKDADSKLAGIQHASQGVFQVMGRDTMGDANNYQNEMGSIEKKVRLVTTIDYQLQ